MLYTFTSMLTHSVRMCRRAPGSSLVIVLTLAIAIAGSITAFSTLNATLLQTLPYDAPESIIYLRHSYRGMGGACSPPLFLDYRRDTTSFDSLSAAMPWNANLTGAGEPERVRGLLVSSDFFATFGVHAILGRTFLPIEDQPGHEHVVVVSDSFWRRRFGARADAIGSAVQLNGESYEVIGVLPPAFRWGQAYGRSAVAEVWAPFALTPARIAENQRGSEFLDVYARLKRGISRDRAQAEIDRTIVRLHARFPARYTEASGFRVTIVPLQTELIGQVRPVLLLVFGAVAALLLAAVTNVAGLLLTRAAGRRGEMSIRAALGAPRHRLVAEYVAEAGVLATAAGIAGVALAFFAVSALDRIDPVTLPRTRPIGIDATVMLFALLVTLFVALGAGLLSAWHGSRSDPMQSLRTGRHAGAGRGTTRVRRVLIVVQTAIALTLLTGAGLLLRSVSRLNDVSGGFRTDGVLAAQLQLPQSRYAAPASRSQFVEGVLTRLSQREGITATGAVSELPLGGVANSGTFAIEGRVIPATENQPHAELWSAAAGYFAALGIRLEVGRLFDERDQAGRPGVAIVNTTFAMRYFPGDSALGKRIDFEGGAKARRWREIVGIVADVRDRQLDKPSEPQLYVPYPQRPTSGLFLVLHASGDPLSALPLLREAVRDNDPDLPLYNVTTIEELRKASTRNRRGAGAALAAFALSAVFLAALGLYALIAQLVRDRIPEIGVRMAIGARPVDVTRLFLIEGGRLIAAGMAVGIAIAVPASAMLRTFLFGVTFIDPVTYAAMAALLTVVGLIACSLPAWRASRIDPLTALRSQ